MNKVLGKMKSIWFEKGRPHKKHTTWVGLEQLCYSVEIHDRRYDRVLDVLAQVYEDAYAEGRRHGGPRDNTSM